MIMLSTDRYTCTGLPLAVVASVLLREGHITSQIRPTSYLSVSSVGLLFSQIS
jgi:hypothetical protein